MRAANGCLLFLAVRLWFLGIRISLAMTRRLIHQAAFLPNPWAENLTPHQAGSLLQKIRLGTALHGVIEGDLASRSSSGMDGVTRDERDALFSPRAERHDLN